MKTLSKGGFAAVSICVGLATPAFAAQGLDLGALFSGTSSISQANVETDLQPVAWR